MTPLCFTYRPASFSTSGLIHVTILGEYKHHFTGEKMYRVREENQRYGMTHDCYYSESAMKRALALRVDEE